MNIVGMQKVSLVDWDNMIVCTLFTYGCNFACPFCHNKILWDNSCKLDTISESTIFEYLKGRTNVIDGVCITGGEPLLHDDISDLLIKIKELGYSIKLDTNGSFPQKLQNLVDSNLVDYVAMDIKNEICQYSTTAGFKDNTYIKNISLSIQYLLSNPIEYEFRTTIVKGLHTKTNIENLCKQIQSAKRYFLQQYQPIKNNTDLASYTDEELREFLSIAKMYVPNTKVRGVESLL